MAILSQSINNNFVLDDGGTNYFFDFFETDLFLLDVTVEMDLTLGWAEDLDAMLVNSAFEGFVFVSDAGDGADFSGTYLFADSGTQIADNLGNNDLIFGGANVIAPTAYRSSETEA